MVKSSPQIGNLFLAVLPREEYARLLPKLKPVRLSQGDVLYYAGDTMQHGYFLTGGMVSMLSTTQSGETLEIAMICNKGVTGAPFTSPASSSPYQLIVQLPADAMKVETHVLREEFNRGGKFQELVLRYGETLLTQIAQSALCACFHTVEKRLCRWLLIAQDCALSDSFDLTHDFISYMLGRSRPNVTAAARALQQANLIRYSRGRVTILNRNGLEVRSCECYRIIKTTRDNFLTAGF